MNVPLQPEVVAAPAEDWFSPNHVQAMVLAAVTLVGGYLCVRLAAPFLSPLTWALGLGVLFVPLQRWLEGKLKRPSAAALVTVSIAALIVVIPIVFVAQRLLVESVHGAELVETRVRSGEWQRSIHAQPQLAPLLNQIEHRIDLPAIVSTISTSLKETVGDFVKGSIVQLVQFGLTFYLLFFFLRDRRSLLHSCRSLVPLPAAEALRLWIRVTDTIHATLFGTLIVSMVQGLLGGLMFWWLGLSASLLWGVVMAFLAVIPVLGAFVIWVPAAMFLALEGNWGKALILTLWGIGVVGTIDNLLRPVLVGNRLRQPTILAFISIVGGLLLFGASGIVLGPVVLTVTTGLLRIWNHRMRAGGGTQSQAKPGLPPIEDAAEE